MSSSHNKKDTSFRRKLKLPWKLIKKINQKNRMNHIYERSNNYKIISIYHKKNIQTIYIGHVSNNFNPHGYGKIFAKVLAPDRYGNIKYHNKWFEGEWYNGKRHGDWIVVRKDRYYTINFDKGVEKQIISFKDFDGNIYKGEFNKDLEPEGYGDYISFDKNIYSGEFKNGIISGRGKAYYPKENCLFEGIHKNGMKHGIGFLKDKFGNKLKAEFKNNDIVNILSMYNHKKNKVYTKKFKDENTSNNINLISVI